MVYAKPFWALYWKVPAKKTGFERGNELGPFLPKRFAWHVSFGRLRICYTRHKKKEKRRGEKNK